MGKAGRYIRVGSKKFTTEEFAKRIQSDLELDALDYAGRVASALASGLQKVVEELQQNSSERGQGFYAVRYNDPLDDAEVVVEMNDKGDGFRVFVDSKVFNILDSGSPGATASDGKPFKFPQYFGRSTQPNSINIANPARVTAEPFWNTVTSVKGFEPRNFYIKVAESRRIRKVNRKNQSLANQISNLPEPETFKFEFSPKDVRVRTIKRG